MDQYLICHYYLNGFDVLERTNDHEEAIEARNQYIVEFNTPNIAVYQRVEFAEEAKN